MSASEHYFDFKVVESGRRAFFAGLKVRDCRLAMRSKARLLWLKGYRSARVGKAAPSSKAESA